MVWSIDGWSTAYGIFHSAQLLDEKISSIVIIIYITIQNLSSYIRKTAQQVVLSRCCAANFAHIWGGGSIRALRSASVGANRSPLDFVHPYE